MMPDVCFVNHIVTSCIGLSIPSSNEYAAIIPANITPSDATSIVFGEKRRTHPCLHSFKISQAVVTW